MSAPDAWTAFTSTRVHLAMQCVWQACTRTSTPCNLPASLREADKDGNLVKPKKWPHSGPNSDAFKFSTKNDPKHPDRIKQPLLKMGTEVASELSKPYGYVSAMRGQEKTVTVR